MAGRKQYLLNLCLAMFLFHQQMRFPPLFVYLLFFRNCAPPPFCLQNPRLASLLVNSIHVLEIPKLSGLGVHFVSTYSVNPNWRLGIKAWYVEEKRPVESEVLTPWIVSPVFPVGTAVSFKRGIYCFIAFIYGSEKRNDNKTRHISQKHRGGVVV